MDLSMRFAVARDQSVLRMIDATKRLLSGGLTRERLTKAQQALADLAAQASLFQESDFPLPAPGQSGRTFLVRDDGDGRHALYVDICMPGLSSMPHDHGASWAIVAGIRGHETHRFYAPVASEPGHDRLRLVSEMTLHPREAIALMPGDIHSIHNLGGEPVVNLHLYARGFPAQDGRKEYDLAAGTSAPADLDSFAGSIEMAPHR